VDERDGRETAVLFEETGLGEAAEDLAGDAAGDGAVDGRARIEARAAGGSEGDRSEQTMLDFGDPRRDIELTDMLGLFGGPLQWDPGVAPYTRGHVQPGAAQRTAMC